MIGPRKVDKDLVLYGYGRLGRLAEEIFAELGIPVLIWDKKLPCPVAQYPEDFLVAVCIASEPYGPIEASLFAQGFTDVAPVWDIIEAYPEVGIGNGWTAGEFTEEDWRQREFVQSRLDDGLSWYSYNHFLEWRRFHIECYMEYIRILPMPSLPSALADIRARQRVITYADAPMETVDIHAEGCELKTLEMNMPLFQKYRPSLRVACYHSRDGLWKIERFCMENLLDYQWTFRLTAYCGQGAYLFGCPKEKIKLIYIDPSYCTE